jgi:hypothetical protein
MIIEDLFWCYKPSESLLPGSLQQILDGTITLPDWELCDVRFMGIVGSVGLLFRTPASFGADLAVLLVQGVSHLAGQALYGSVASWDKCLESAQATLTYWRWRIGLSNGTSVEITGTRAILFAGRTPGNLTVAARKTIDTQDKCRTQIPSWTSPFELTMQPGCSDTEIASGYIQWDDDD